MRGGPMTRVKAGVVSAIVPLVMVSALQVLRADFIAVDPGVRNDGINGAGGRIAGLTATQRAFFANSRDEFEQVEEIEEGLGPRFNLDSCVGCHKQPASGGARPPGNPPGGVGKALGPWNTGPSFIKLYGPRREARLKQKPNGSPHGGARI